MPAVKGDTLCSLMLLRSGPVAAFMLYAVGGLVLVAAACKDLYAVCCLLKAGLACCLLET